MNLKSFLQDESLANLDWLSKPKTFEPSGKDTDKKDDLAIEWGRTGEIEVPQERILARKVKPEDTTSEVLHVARALLMSGAMGSTLVAALRKRFDKSTLRSASKRLIALLEKEEGVTGCVAVDPQGYKDCLAAWKVASNSPYKRLLKFVLMREKCASCRFLAKTGTSKREAKIGATSVDDFFNEETVEEQYRPFCTRLARTILSGQQDFDDSEMDKTLIDLVTLGKLTKEEAEKIRSLNKTAYEKVRMAFRHVLRKSEAAKKKAYSEKVDASEYKITQDMQFEVSDAPKTEKQADVQMKLGETSQAIDEAPDLTQTNAQSVDVDFGVKERLSGVEIDAEQKDIEVDPATFLESEFEGTEIVALDEEKKPKKPLKVNHRPDLTIE
jgi:hypothetical protein